MKKFLSILLALVLLLSIAPLVAAAYDNPTTKTQLWWIINAARGNGEFSYEFELAPTAAQVEAGQHGQRGIVEGKDGVVRVFHRNADGSYTEATNSVAMAVFARNFRLLTQRDHNHNNEVGGVRPYAPPFPEWLGLTNDGVGFGNGNYELFPLVTHETLANASNPYDINLPSPDPNRENAMLFIYDEGAMSAVQYMNIATGNYVYKRISNLQPSLSGVTPRNHTTKTLLWWIIDAARGNGEFSYEFELAATAAQAEAGQHGQRGIVEGKDGVVRVYHRNADGSYTETTNSAAMAIFARNFRLLTQRNHNHNNEVEGVRPYEPPFPEWLGLTDNGVGFGNGNYELFPLVTHETLANAPNPFEMNLLSPDPNRENAMLFIYDGGAMSAVQFWNIVTESYVYKKISNLQPSLSGVTPRNYSTKTQLWWIIDAARGNGEFSFDFQFEDGTNGRMTGKDGVLTAFDQADNIVTNSRAITLFGNSFALLTQRNHNHNNEVEGVRPYEPPFPEWLGLTDNGVGFGNGNYELFPLITQETLANAFNPFEINLLSPDPNREHAMLFIYDGGTMSAVQFRVDGNYEYMIISNLRNSIAIEAPNLNTASAWARERIQSAFEKGFIPTEIQNNYTSAITRLEFCRMAVLWVEYVLGMPIHEIVAERGIAERQGHTFSDTTDPYIIAAYRLGIIDGTTYPTATSPGVFHPDGLLNRQQAAVVIMRACRAIGATVGNAPDADFVDMNQAANWAHQGINFVQANGIMHGVGGDRFGPLSNYTREMSIVTFNNIDYDELPGR